MLKLIQIIGAVLIALPLQLHAAEKLVLDDQHSYIVWRVTHFGFSNQLGKGYVSGVVVLDKENPAKSTVEANLKIANMTTGLKELDNHLQGPLFFDAAKYPTARFVSDSVKIINPTSAKVHGILTLHGISKPITLSVTINKTGRNPLTDRVTTGFSATTSIKRSEFGMKTLLPNVSDEVSIEIGAEAAPE